MFLGLTLAVEIPIVAAIFAGQRIRMAAVCGVTTLLTHLALHFVLPHFIRGQMAMILGEAAVLLLEWAVYAMAGRPRDPGRALVASAAANAASFAAGIPLATWLAGG